MFCHLLAVCERQSFISVGLFAYIYSRDANDSIVSPSIIRAKHTKGIWHRAWQEPYIGDSYNIVADQHLLPFSGMTF